MKKIFKVLLPMMALIGIATVFTSCADMFTSPEHIRFVREDSRVSPDHKIDIQICSGDMKNGSSVCGSTLRTVTLGFGESAKISDVITGFFLYGLKVRPTGTGDYVEIRNGDTSDAEVCCLAMNKDYDWVVHAAWDTTNNNVKYYYSWERAQK